MNGTPQDNRGGYGGDRGRNDYDDRSSSRGGGGYDRSGGAITGSNREPVRPRDGGGYGDRDRDRGYSRGREDDYSRKRPHEEGGYEDPRKIRRY